jgi:hypothetical protein
MSSMETKFGLQVQSPPPSWIREGLSSTQKMTLETSLEEFRLLTLTSMSSIEVKFGLQGQSPPPSWIREDLSSTQK